LEFGWGTDWIIGSIIDCSLRARCRRDQITTTAANFPTAAAAAAAAAVLRNEYE